MAWGIWRGVSASPQFDPVSAVIALVALATSVVAVGQGRRAQQHAETNIAEMVRRLAVRVEQAETKARRQLLGGHDRIIDVGFEFVPARGHDAAGAAETGRLGKVVDYYRRLRPRRLVITGVGGSGKTVLAIDLILRLLQDRGADDPVPVRLSAAALDTRLSGESPELAVRDWLIAHLRQTFSFSEVAARELVAAGMVLPVLDGLDEMDATEEPGYASRAAQTIRACNAYLAGTEKAAMVLTCRIGQYRALEDAGEWVHDAARIRLNPVGLPAARRFLTRRALDNARWEPVLTAMRRGGNRALRTPNKVRG
jgi:hypothetical protein